MGKYIDRRKFQRLSLFIDVVFKVYKDYQRRIFLDNKEIRATTLDISERGIGLQTNHPISERSILDITINVTNLNKKGQIVFNKPIKAVGSVRWMTSWPDNSYRIGIVFVEIGQKDKQAIRTYIDRHTRSKEKKIIEKESTAGRKYPRYRLKKENGG